MSAAFPPVRSGDPDGFWEDLVQRYGGGSLLNSLLFSCVAQFIRGRIAFVAVPECCEGGPDLEGAARWVRALNHRGVCAVSPALLGGGMNPVVTGTDALWGLPLLSASGAVIVPKLAGWDRCGAVIWTARRALSMNVPVYLVDDTGEA